MGNLVLLQVSHSFDADCLTDFLIDPRGQNLLKHLVSGLVAFRHKHLGVVSDGELESISFFVWDLWLLFIERFVELGKSFVLAAKILLKVEGAQLRKRFLLVGDVH